MSIVIERTDGNKCPRCWRYWGIPELPQGICDRCAQGLLQNIPEDYFKEPEEQENFRTFQNEIKQAYCLQQNKYLLDKSK